MVDLLVFATMLFVCGGLGLPLARVVPARFAWRWMLAPTLGCAALAVVVPIGYRFGLSMRALLFVTAIVAVGLIALELRRRPRIPLAIAAAWLATSLVLLAPRWTGGDQFAVFQGNQWDTYAYLDSAMAYATRPYAAIHHAGTLQQLRNPFFTIAQVQLEQRPSVHELYAMFSRVAPGEAYRSYYAFLVYFMAQLVLVGLFVARSVLPRAPPAAWLAIAAAFPLGFWGQYVFDINAWSQLASAPLLFALFGLALHIPDERDQPWRLAGAIAIVVAGSVYMYPEGFFIYVAAIAPVVVVRLAIAMVRARRFEPRRLIPLCGIAGVLAAALYPPVLHFLVSQLTWTAGTIVPWWQFFQRFFVGRDDVWGDGMPRAVDFVGGLFGFYFATPSDEDGLILRLAIVAVLVGLVVALVRMLREPMVAAWSATALLMLAPAAYLAHHDNYWAAGKVISYAAPVFVTALCLPLARATRWRWFAAAYVALQVGAGIVRIAAATWDDHIGFAAPYPAIQTVALKHDIGWDLRGLEPLLDASSKVTLHPSEPWSQNAMMVFLTARGIPYVLQGAVAAAPGGVELGKMPMPWTPNVELSILGTSVELSYFDGRPPVTVTTR